MIDSQVVKTGRAGGPERGYDGSKRLAGRKRHILVDTNGLVLAACVHGADLPDRDGGRRLLAEGLGRKFSRLELVWADGKYRNHRLDRWLAQSEVAYRIEVVGRPAGSKGFVKLPRRWVVERTFAWLGRYRRNSRDYEYFPSSSESMIRISSIHRMLRLLKPDLSKPTVPFKYRKSQGIITG